jgi:hypothetical protein
MHKCAWLCVDSRASCARVRCACARPRCLARGREIMFSQCRVGEAGGAGCQIHQNCPLLTHQGKGKMEEKHRCVPFVGCTQHGPPPVVLPTRTCTRLRTAARPPARAAWRQSAACSPAPGQGARPCLRAQVQLSVSSVLLSHALTSWKRFTRIGQCSRAHTTVFLTTAPHHTST